MLEAFIYLIPHIFLAYSLMYFVIPRYLLKQRYLATTLWVVVIFLLTGLISALLSLTVIEEIRLVMMGDWYRQYRGFTSINVFLSLMAGLRGGVTIGGIAAAIKLMKYWYVKEQRNLQLQKENAEARLQLLKAQVHPHFLFNTLNNIYSHTQNTAPVASQLVSGLSDLLRFILYESSQPTVSLSKEISMIKDYISLEQVRYGNELDLQLDLPKDSGDLHIAPLLLLPFLENSFKHGASNIIEGPWISLSIHVNGNLMHMKLINGKPTEARPLNGHSGLGIENVQKRLELIYPEKHQLTITTDEDVFVVNLKLELESRKSSIVNTIPQEKTIHA